MAKDILDERLRWVFPIAQEEVKLVDAAKMCPYGKRTLERSHRSGQESFYDRQTFRSFKDLQLKLRKWNIEYNDLEHCGLQGKTPNEALKIIS